MNKTKLGPRSTAVPDAPAGEEIVGDQSVPEAPSRIWRIVRDLTRWLAPIVAFVILWEIVGRFGPFSRTLLPPATRIGEATWKLYSTGDILPDIGISVKRAATGFTVASVIGLTLGLLIGHFEVFNRFLAPLFELFRQLSPLALLPLFVLFLGLGFHSQVAIIAWAAVWPILLNTISGARQIEPSLLKAARSLGANRSQIFTKVVLPYAVPTIATGLRLGGTYALLVLVAAEMVGGNSGLGYRIIQSQYLYRIPQMYAFIVTTAVLGLVVNLLLVSFETRMTRWKQDLKP
jgi:NitT/TauT family transport system permease protein